MKMRQSQIFLGAIVLTLGILSVGPGVRATEPMDGGTNGNTTGEPFEGAGINLQPFRTNQNLTLAVESSDEAAEADQLAKQLSNPVASLISVPFQANEDWGFGPTGNGYKFTLNIQPVIPISISKDWNVIVRPSSQLFPSTIFSTSRIWRRIRSCNLKTVRRTVLVTPPRASSCRLRNRVYSD